MKKPNSNLLFFCLGLIFEETINLCQDLLISHYRVILYTLSLLILPTILVLLNFKLIKKTSKIVINIIVVVFALLVPSVYTYCYHFKYKKFKVNEVGIIVEDFHYCDDTFNKSKRFVEELISFFENNGEKNVVVKSINTVWKDHWNSKKSINQEDQEDFIKLLVDRYNCSIVLFGSIQEYNNVKVDLSIGICKSDSTLGLKYECYNITKGYYLDDLIDGNLTNEPNQVMNILSGLCFESENKYDEAIQVYKNKLKGDSTHIMPEMNSIKYFLEARALQKKYIDCKSNSTDNKCPEDSCLTRSKSLFYKTLKIINSESPFYAETNFRMGWFMQEIEIMDSARNYYEKAFSIKHDNCDYLRSYYNALKKVNDTTAIQKLKKNNRESFINCKMKKELKI